MARVLAHVTLATLLGASGLAAAQPAAPAPAPAPPPIQADAPPVQDPALAEQIASSLLSRAQDLFDARELADAKQLAVEAVVTSPNGAAADTARQLIHKINVQLGIPEEQAPPPVTPPPVKAAVDPDAPATDAPTRVTKSPLGDLHARRGRTAAAVHGGLYVGVLGATLGTIVTDDDGQLGVGVALGLASGAAAAVYLAPVIDRHFDEAQIRTIGSGSVWGGVIGGFMADITTGVGVGSSGTSARQVMIGASIGSTAGALGGYALASSHKLTRGDVALVDTLAGIGTMGGLTVGMLMQPAQSEAYDVNAVIGAAAGVAIGLGMSASTNTTPRRMLRVAEYAAIGGVAPFVLLAALGTSSGDERAVGALSTIGLVGGAYLGFRSTAQLDVGLDVPDGVADAPPAVIGRASDGHWQIGTPGLQPLARQLDDHQRGLGLTLLGGRF